MSSNAPSSETGVAMADAPAAPRPIAPVPAASERPMPPAPARNGSRRPMLFGILGLLALIAVGWGVRQVLWGRSHVRTDDAQVEGHVVPVLAKVTGYVTAVAVIENQSVRLGDPLVQIDDREYRAKLSQNDADLSAALATAGERGHVGQAVAQVAAARAMVEQAQATAARAHADLERYRTLAPRGVVTRQQLDGAEAAASVADAQLDASRKQVQAASAALQGADAKVASVRAQRDQAELNVSWTHVTAPITGVVSRKNVEVGQLVSAGQPLMSVVPLDDVWIVANLKETEVSNVEPGDHAEIEVDAYHGRRFPARVESISAATGAKFSLLPPDNATGNFTKVVQRIPVRLRLEKGQDPQHPLRPGMSAQVTITTR